MTPKLTATASASGTATSRPPISERSSRNEETTIVMSAIWRMFRSLPWTITSVAAVAFEASVPV